ncbi:BrnT family toxin [Bosea sp. PAMC 26642]|uniref:BrnT family toxin n=1 Tax=Bosea sp. (strain PAMC 26642) TaxID=1792307 RepID=UPI0009EA288B|nr:BrnT family toxin [Bosea sp. PAMC 26642]
MDVEFDPDKDAANVVKHGISLGRAKDLEVLAFQEDVRFGYGEIRYRAWGLIDGATYCLAFARREGRLRAISLRRAHNKEIRRHVPQDRL